MAAITIRTNISTVFNNLAEKLSLLKSREYLLRPVAIETIANMKDRIHIKGEASDGGQIGTYSTAYMKVRTGNYGNAVRFSKGAKKGFIKNAGIVTKKKVQLFGTTQSVFADVKPLNQQRANYHRSADTKVIISLTRQLENDYAVLATDKGYGIGFQNKLNFNKSKWVEETYGKKIFALSEDEKKYVRERLNELTNDALNS